jgi:hypothetical protein
MCKITRWAIVWCRRRAAHRPAATRRNLLPPDNVHPTNDTCAYAKCAATLF